MFKPTSRCRAPHVHMDSLRESLFEFGVVRATKAESAGDLLAWLQEKNGALKKVDEARWLAMRGRTSEKAMRKALEKANKHKFWLGMPGAMGLVLGGGK